MTHTYYPPSVGPVPTDPTTSFKNDDYHADLDAENFFRLIINGNDYIDAINVYYSSLSSENTRANIFLGNISLSTVKGKIFAYSIHKTENDLRVNYPDTYNFICSLQDGSSDMGSYAS